MTTKRPSEQRPTKGTQTTKMVTQGETHGYKPSPNAQARPVSKPPAPPEGSGGGSR